MRATWRPVVHGAVLVGGIAVFFAGALQARAEDAWLYAVYVVVALILNVRPVQVMPNLGLPIPTMAATAGFLYIGGLPLVPLRIVVELVMAIAVRVLPARWTDRVPQLRASREMQLEGAAHQLHGFPGFPLRLAEYSVFALSLWTRWVIAMWITDGAPVWTSVFAIAVAEAGGYAISALLALLPVYPDRALFPTRAWRVRDLMGDVALVLEIVLTAFVYLIVYGYAVVGLPGATTFALASLGAHAVLARLNERRQRLEEQNETLEQLNRELEHRERLSAIGKMSSVVSHQMLQQLGVIGIYANLVRSAEASDGDSAIALSRAREHGRAIGDALEDVNRVLCDLLVFSRDLRVNLYEHSVATLLEETNEAVQARADEHGVRIRIECPPDLVATLDKLKMKQAIENVLRNAIEASLQGGEVSVGAAAKDGTVEIAISDGGPGVPHQNREAIFTPFFTTKEHGSGLGLAIAREFTRAHGGTLHVERGDGGRGARFVFRLPLSPEESTAQRA